MDDAPADELPYLELTSFFYRNNTPTINLHFREIEQILGDTLPWEAYFFDAFWYDDAPELTSPMWKEEGFPFRTFRFSEMD